MTFLLVTDGIIFNDSQRKMHFRNDGNREKWSILFENEQDKKLENPESQQMPESVNKSSDISSRQVTSESAI